MDYQWYPGHMTKARRRMQDNLKLVDLVIELTDARCVQSGRNPDIDSMAAGKSRVVVLTKADLADPAVNKAWIRRMQEEGIHAAAIDARKNSGLGEVREQIAAACAAKIERDRARGIKNRPVRAMVVGIPNVGKSTFINSIAGKASARTGNKPGVTKGEQWIHTNRSLDLLDTPGILWPKFEDQTVGLHLSLTGTIRDEILDHEEMALALADFLAAHYPDAIADRYGIEGLSVEIGAPKSGASDDAGAGISGPSGSVEARDIGASDDGAAPKSGASEDDILARIALARSMLAPGGLPDRAKAADALIDDFRKGNLGRISLEYPERL